MSFILGVERRETEVKGIFKSNHYCDLSLARYLIGAAHVKLSKNIEKKCLTP